jgi:hypothetical protein
MTGSRTRPDPARPTQPAGAAAIVGALLAFVLAFLWRFLNVEFVNDHYMHLAQAQQVLRGELPARDFFDFGLPFQILTSAAALAWSGHNLYGEAIVTIAFVSAGAALTFFMAQRLSQSLTIASMATLMAIVSSARLYNYPKVFFYVLAPAVAWRYVRSPGRNTLAVLAAATVLAFYYRHDHGVYIGIVMLPFLVLAHWPELRRAVLAGVTYGAFCLALLLPFFIYLSWAGGIGNYIASNIPHARLAVNPRVNRMPFTIVPSEPLVEVRPARERRFNVRWSPGVNDADRQVREAKYSLHAGTRVEGNTYSYVAGDESTANIRALIADPAAEDTNGIDRGRGTLDIRESFAAWLQRVFVPFRTRLAPGVFHNGNALAWSYYVALLVPVAALLTFALLVLRRRIEHAEMAVAGMTILLCLVIVQTIVRGSPDSRLADVAGPLCILGAWLVGRWLYAVQDGGWRRRAGVAAALAFWTMTIWSVGAGTALARLEPSGFLNGPAAMADQWSVMSGRLRERPIDRLKPADPRLDGVTRYVFDCTAEDDRVLVGWFQPDVYFVSERGFAGGQVQFHPGWDSRPEDQQLTVERLKRQRVPIAILSQQTEAGFNRHFPLVRAYLDANYRQVTPAIAREIDNYKIFVDRRLTPRHQYEPLGLPCYR